MSLLILKRANGLKTSYGDTFDKLLDFFDHNYHFLETFDTKTRKLGLKWQKRNLCLFLIIKRANGLKMRYGDIFDNFLDLFEQKYHFLETFDTKTLKIV